MDKKDNETTIKQGAKPHLNDQKTVEKAKCYVSGRAKGK